MKKILSVFIGALALILSVTSVKAEVFPNRLVSGVLPTSGVLNVSTDNANLLSFELWGLQEGSFVMKFYTQAGSGTVSLSSIVTDDIVTAPVITRGSFSTPAGQYDTEVLFQVSNRVPGRYTSGTVTLSCTTPWTFPGKTDVVLIKINATGPVSTDSCWVAAYRPPTATEVTNFAVSVSSATNRVVIRKLIGGKLTPVSTNTTVTTTASYQIGIGNSDDVAVGVQGERWNTITGQYELFPVGPLWTVSVGMTVGGSAVVPNDQDGKYILVAYAADGTATVVAVFNCNAPPPPNTN